ncbi:MAG TPA: hypothetical protein EYP10_02480, partial [Armatimonadetes bacterium]|nr:hypothetical protein [Armatimonadota bacterium]
MKNQVIEKLSGLLNDGIDVHRCAAARALGVIAGPQATAVLVEALMDEDPDVRVDVATALAGINDPSTAQKLMENFVGDPDSDVKKAALSALIEMRHEPVLPLMRKLVTSRSEGDITWDEDEFYESGWDNWDDIQFTSIRGLGDFGDEQAAGEILNAMANEEGQDVSEVAFVALAKMGATGARALATMYEIKDARLSRRIARAASASDNPHLSEMLTEMLEDTSAVIRAIALEKVASDDARLVDLFADPEPSVRAATVRVHGAANLVTMREMISDDAPEVRIEVFKVIAANPKAFAEDDDVEALKKTLKGDPEAAKHAALALFAVKGPKVAKGFTHVLAKQDIPREFRIGVLETLEKAGDMATPALLSVAADPDRQLRLASLTVLANIAADTPAW